MRGREGLTKHIVYLFEIPKEEIKTPSKNLHDELFSSWYSIIHSTNKCTLLYGMVLIPMDVRTSAGQTLKTNCYWLNPIKKRHTVSEHLMECSLKFKT